MIIAKISWNGELRRVRLEDTDLSLARFRQKLGQVFGPSFPMAAALAYIDEDGDPITVRTSAELKDAFDMQPERSGVRVVRFRVGADENASADENGNSRFAENSGAAAAAKPSTGEAGNSPASSSSPSNSGSPLDQLLGELGLGSLEAVVQMPFVQQLGPAVQGFLASAVQAAEQAASHAAEAAAHANAAGAATAAAGASADADADANADANDASFNINVETLSGETVPVQVRRSDTIRSVKEKVAAAQAAQFLRYTCDGCDERIAANGTRWHCTDCSDFDLCEPCFRRANDIHPGHRFTAVAPAAAAPAAAANTAAGDAEPTTASDTPVLHHYVVCDACQGAVQGVRYKCGACMDYDLCADCWLADEHGHDADHVFMAFRRERPRFHPARHAPYHHQPPHHFQQHHGGCTAVPGGPPPMHGGCPMMACAPPPPGPPPRFHHHRPHGHPGRRRTPANTANTAITEQLAQLMEMGFDESKARNALNVTNNNVQEAIILLINN